MTPDTIIIPRVQRKKSKTSCDCLSHLYRVKLLGFYNELQRPCPPGPTFTVTNPTNLIVKPHQSKELNFNIFVTTSLPGYCLLFGPDQLYWQGLTYMIHPIKTNDQPLKVTIFNQRDHELIFEKDHLQFSCKVIIATL